MQPFLNFAYNDWAVVTAGAGAAVVAAAVDGGAVVDVAGAEVVEAPASGNPPLLELDRHCVFWQQDMMQESLKKTPTLQGRSLVSDTLGVQEVCRAAAMDCVSLVHKHVTVLSMTA